MTEINHREGYLKFIKEEIAAGGPDPQIALIEELSRPYPTQDRIWMAGCYASCHCVPTAYVTWSQWRPYATYFDSAGGELEKWLREHWAGLPVRPEMRSHRMPEKRAKCLHDFARYALEWTPERTAKPYERVWSDAIDSVKYFGRYMAIKYLEMLRRLIPADNLQMPDLRAKGSWSPRRTLSWLYPYEPILGSQDESKSALAVVDFYTQRLQNDLAAEGVEINKFQIQVLLCEYREALAGGFYPGGTHDEELDYIKLVEKEFGTEAVQPVYDARKRIFPNELLGELNGWNGLRKEKFQVFKVA